MEVLGMKAPLYATQKIIEDFTRTHSIPLRLRKPRFWMQRGDAYYDTYTYQFTLPIKARGAELREFTYHEIGHALIHQFRIPKEFISRFVALSPGLPKKKAIALMCESEPAPEGWVSWYAQTCGTEDFCETLGAWAANGYRSKGKWKFNNFEFDVTHDRRLQKKIKWVQQIVEVCYFQAQRERVVLTKRKAS
jgi:hypothetical protein